MKENVNKILLDFRYPLKFERISEIPNIVDLNEIKNLIEIDGGKFIIVENGKPEMVVMSFDDYKKRLLEKKTIPAVVRKEQRIMPKELESEPLKLEDLPL